jgi:hypothetical protein
MLMAQNWQHLVGDTSVLDTTANVYHSTSAVPELPAVPRCHKTSSLMRTHCPQRSTRNLKGTPLIAPHTGV